MLPRLTAREVPVSDANEAGSWEGVLAPDEIIEWQGAPVQGVFWELPFWEAAGILALGLAGLALLLAGRSDIAQAALVFFAWGVVYTVWFHARSFWNRRRTFYSLTNQRAFIGTSHLGVMRLLAWPLHELSDIHLVEGTPGHVYLTTERVLQSGRRGGQATVPIGFTHLSDARLVHVLVVRLRQALDRNDQN